MRVVITATGLPGRAWGTYRHIHVALQVGRDPHDAVPADAASASWETEVQVIGGEGGPDFRGPAVQGKRGERFLYLTWGEVRGDSFHMFRRAKLMLADLGPGVTTATQALGAVSLTDALGAPLCARAKPDQISWTLT